MEEPNKEKVSKRKTEGLAVWSVGVGIISVVVIGTVGINIYGGILPLLGLFLGEKSYRRIKKGEGRLGGRFCALVGSTVSLFLLVVIFMFVVSPAILGKIELAARSKTYDGDSGQLEKTVVVPTLDTPAPKGKNIIWCSSFQLAWNALKDNVVGEPVIVKGAEELSNKLNTAEQSREDLLEESFYADAGLVKEGILEKIKKEVRRRFPGEPIAQITGRDEAIVAYSHLAANVKFKNPFFENTKSLVFTESTGNESEVTSFGIRKEDQGASRRLREQVDILLYARDPNNPLNVRSLAVDLCKYTEPYQVVLALTEPKGTLGETLADLKYKIEEFREKSAQAKIGINDILIVPNMFWRIAHHLKELEGKYLSNEGYQEYPFGTALQTIEFKLDRTGASLRSTALLIVLSGPRRLIFNRPFLIYMKKRGAERPFFVMWVDNAELLSEWREE
jgi:hypothetical protein